MPDANKRQQAYRFDDVFVDVGEFRVSKDSQLRRITPRAFEVLVFFLANAGRIVSKQELFDAVWQESFVTDNALTRMVKEVRHVIGDDADAPRYIETVPKRGYRFIADVEEVGAAEAAARPESEPSPASIAVLPFINETDDAENDYLTEGITESIIKDLSRLTSLRVAPRSTVFRFHGRETDPIDVGGELKVRVVLSGRVQERAETLVVNVELIDVSRASQIWGERYHHDLTDIFDLQKEIAEKICAQLRLKLAKDETKQTPPNPEAYRLYLKGRYFWNRRPQGLHKGVEYFQEALEKDGNFALAHAGLADCYSTLGSWENGGMPPSIAMPRACATAERALAIDASLAEAHTTLAYAKLHYDCDFAGAEAGFKHALQLNSNYVHAWHWLSHFYMAIGQIEKSLEASLQALELDPLDLIINVHLAWHYWLARQPDAALRQAEKARELDPNVIWSSFFAGLAFEEKEQYSAAVAQFGNALSISPEFPLLQAALSHAMALNGQPNEAREIAESLERHRSTRTIPAYDIAIARLGMGDDSALRWLKEAVDEHSGWAIYLAVEPRLDPLRATPQFSDLIERIGLAKYHSAIDKTLTRIPRIR